jgi:hypothetical protein
MQNASIDNPRPRRQELKVIVENGAAADHADLDGPTEAIISAC